MLTVRSLTAHVRQLLPRKRRKGRPPELLEAALDLLSTGSDAPGRHRHSRGVSKGTNVFYFAGKEALFKAVIQDGLIPALAEPEAPLAGHEGSARPDSRALVERWWSRVGRDALPGIPKLMIAEARNFPEGRPFYYENVVPRPQGFAAALTREWPG